MNAAELQFIIKAQDQASATIDQVGSSFSDMGEMIKAQIAAMTQLAAAMNASASGSKNAAAATHEHAAAHKEAASAAQEHEKEELSLGRALERVANQAKEAAEAMIGLWASNEMAKATVEAAVDTEHAINDIARASGMARGEVKELHEELAKVSMKDGYATIEQLDQLAKVGARMGGSSEQIQKFAQTISMLGKGSDLQPIAQGIRQILEATGEGIEGVDKLGEALAALDAKSKDGVGGLLPLMQMLVARTGDLKLSSEDIAAYAATFEKLGGRPERFIESFGGSVRALKKAAEDGSQGLNILAHQAGESADAFRTLAREHPEQGFNKLLEVVKKLQDQGSDPANLLSRLGIGPEQVAGVEALAKQYDTLIAKQKLAAKPPEGSAKAKGDSDTLDYEKAVNGLTTAWTEFKSAVGEDLIGPLTTSFNALAGVLNGVTSLLGMVDVNTRRMAEAFVIGATGVFGIVKIGGELLEVLSGVREAFILTGETAVEETAKTGEAMAATAAEHGAQVVESAAATEAKLVEIGEAGTAAAATAGTSMLSGFAMKALAITAILSSIHEVMEGVGTMMNQYSAITKMGANWGDIGAALNPFNSQADLQRRMQRERDESRKKQGEGGEPKEGGGEPKEGAEKKGEEAQDHSIDARVQAAQVLNEETFKALEGYDGQLKKLADIKKIQDAITEAEKIRTSGGAGDDEDKKVLDRLNLTKQRLAYETMMANPLQAQGRAIADQIAKAQAVTKAQQNRLAVEEQIRKMEEVGQLDASHPGDEAHNQVRSGMQAAQSAEAQKGYDEAMRSLHEQLIAASAITSADKARIDIDKQVNDLIKSGVIASKEQEQAFRNQAAALKEVNAAMTQFKSLNPQGEAQLNYQDQVTQLKRRYPQGGDEYDREKTKLDNDTLAQRDPIGQIAQSEKEELAQLQVVGKYREADLKTLQQMTDLKKQGLLVDEGQSAAVQAQLSANNRQLQDIKDMQGQLDSLTTSFGQGLSTAIGSALNGQKYAFDKFAAGFGQKMMDMAFTNLAKQFEPSINGLLGGMFGDAKGGISKLTGLGASQASKTLTEAEKTVATMTVNATSVTINGNVASGLPGSATTGGASPLPTIQGAGGTALQAAEGASAPSTSVNLSPLQQLAKAMGGNPGTVGASSPAPAAVGGGSPMDILKQAMGGAGAVATAAGKSVSVSSGEGPVPAGAIAANPDGSINWGDKPLSTAGPASAPTPSEASTTAPAVAATAANDNGPDKVIPAQMGGISGSSPSPSAAIGQVTGLLKGGGAPGATPAVPAMSEADKLIAANPDWAKAHPEAAARLQQRFGNQPAKPEGERSPQPAEATAPSPAPATTGSPYGNLETGQYKFTPGGAGTASAPASPASPFGNLADAKAAFANRPAPASATSAINDATRGHDVDISDHDLDSIARVGQTEVAPASIIGQAEHDKQLQGFVDVSANRMSTGQYKSFDDMYNVKNQFSKINGPSSVKPYGSVANVPAATPSQMAEYRSALASRADGSRPDMAFGGKNYLNPAFSDKTNLDAWGNSVVSQGHGYGTGNSTQYYGVAPGDSPVGKFGIHMPGDPASQAGGGYKSMGDLMGEGKTFGNQITGTNSVGSYVNGSWVPNWAHMPGSPDNTASRTATGGSSTDAVLRDNRAGAAQIKDWEKNGVDTSPTGSIRAPSPSDVTTQSAIGQSGNTFSSAMDPAIRQSATSLKDAYSQANVAAGAGFKDKILSPINDVSGGGSSSSLGSPVSSLLNPSGAPQSLIGASSPLPADGQGGGGMSQILGQAKSLFGGGGGGATSAIQGGGISNSASLLDPAASAASQASSQISTIADTIPGTLDSATSALTSGLTDAFSGFGDMFAGLFHTGGRVGGNDNRAMRSIGAAAFASARRYHDGLGDDEFPAILQRGERVLTANQDQRATALMGRMADMMANTSTPAGTQHADSGRQKNGNSMTMIVNTPNASSFRSSQSQIMATQHAAMQRMGAKHN